MNVQLLLETNIHMYPGLHGPHYYYAGCGTYECT